LRAHRNLQSELPPGKRLRDRPERGCLQGKGRRTAWRRRAERKLPGCCQLWRSGREKARGCFGQTRDQRLVNQGNGEWDQERQWDNLLLHRALIHFCFGFAANRAATVVTRTIRGILSASGTGRKVQGWNPLQEAMRHERRPNERQHQSQYFPSRPHA
jgi:hypothetical protein